MIKIYIDNDQVKITGHACSDVCAAVSSVTITIANSLLNLQSTGIDDGVCTIEDNVDDDYMQFKIEKHSKITDTLIKTMLNCYKDICDDFPDWISIIKKDI